MNATRTCHIPLLEFFDAEEILCVAEPRYWTPADGKKVFMWADMPPSCIVEAAQRVSSYFAERNIVGWRLNGCADRNIRDV